MVLGSATAMTRRNASRPATWLVDNAMLPGMPGFSGTPIVLDWGCGHGFDADAFGWHGYDPAHRRLGRPLPGETWMFAYCGYVLNVLEEDERDRTIDTLRNLARIIYVAVRRDLPKQGAPGRGCRQHYVTLEGEGIELVHETSQFAIYRIKGHDHVNTAS